MKNGFPVGRVRIGLRKQSYHILLCALVRFAKGSAETHKRTKRERERESERNPRLGASLLNCHPVFCRELLCACFGPGKISDWGEKISPEFLEMEFTLPPNAVGDFTGRYSVSVTPFNVTFSDDSQLVPSSSNDTISAATRDTTSLIIAVCITALYSLICVVGLLGNVLVMYGVVR